MNLDIEYDGLTRDVTDADVHVGLARLSSTGPRFAVLDRGPHQYIQAYALDSGDLHVEYREGGPDRSYEAAYPQAKAAVVDAFLNYLHEDDRWRTAVEWRRVPADR